MRMKKIFSSLTFWVLLSIITGIIIGHFSPQTGVKMEFLGKWFIEVIRIFISPIIFLTISLGISGMSDLKKVGKVGGKAVLYFEVITTVALLIGLLMAHIIEPGAGIKMTHSISSGSKSAINDFSWLTFLKENHTIQVLIISIASGIFLSQYSQKERVIHFLTKISKYIFKCLHIVMYLAPVGAFGGMAYTIGKYGIATLIPLAKLMGTVYATMAIFIFLVLYFILRYYKVSIFRFLYYIRAELLIVLGTSSSEAGLPSLMEKLEKMGCSKSIVGLVVPAGYSFNLDGTTIYLSMSVLFLAQVYGVDLSTEQILTIIGILMVTSKGAAGVTGSGFMILASTLTAIKVIPIEGLTILFGVDKFMSEARSVTNFIGNGVATIWISNNEGEFDRVLMEKAFKKTL